MTLGSGTRQDITTAENASDAVLGVLRAQLDSSPNDAAVLMMGYMTEALEQGQDTSRAWMLLYIEATKQVRALLERLSEATGKDREDLLQEIALEHAARSRS